MAPERTGGRSQSVRQLELPTIIFGAVEVHRLLRELETLEDFLQQAQIRQPGKQLQLPRTSRILETVAGNNNLNLLVSKERAFLKAFLQKVATTAPVIHMSFASDPSATFTAKIVAWFRTNIHPYALIQLGLQPTIAAGCVARTSNRVFDFSLRNRFYEKRELLLTALDAPVATGATSPPEASLQTATSESLNAEVRT